MLRAISIKTQARRLAIITEFINSMSKNGLPKEFLSNKMTTWSELNQSFFTSSPYNSGQLKKGIDTRSSNSFKNYLDAVFQLKLADEISNLISPSSYGKVLKSLLKNVDHEPYPLIDTEKIFYLFILLFIDADIILTTISIVRNFPEKNLSYYQDAFKINYSERLSKKVKESNGKDRALISEALTRVKNWQNPKRYSEDLVPPRLNWMIDLGIIDTQYYTQYGLFRLSDFGHHFINLIPINNGYSDVSKEWLNRSFISSLVFHDDNKIRWNDLSESAKEHNLYELLNQTFKEFSTLGLKRIPLNSSLLYVTISLFIKNNIIADINNIELFIGFERKIKDSVFGIRESARSYESYMLLKNVV